VRFLTDPESRAWATGSGFPLDGEGKPISASAGELNVTSPIPHEHAKLTWLSRHIEQSLQPRSKCLLWVTTWGVWPSSENWHLYYRLRQSYGDQRLLHEAPGHLFLDYEAGDLVSFIEVAILCGWDAHLLPTAGHARVFFSHDAFIEFWSEDREMIEAFERPLKSPPPETAA
jgi:hypothetical protein